MKKSTTIVALSMIFSFCYGQKPLEIHYKETIKIELPEEQLKKMEELGIADMFPKSQSFDKVLVFNNGESVYKTVSVDTKNEKEISNDEGTIRISFGGGGNTDNILYSNLANKEIVHQQDFMGKAFVVSNTVDESIWKWKIGTDKVKYLGYECTKAIHQSEDGSEVVAWFTTQLPYPTGPSVYNKLPGAILMVSINDGQMEIKATIVKTENVDVSVITVPKEGKKVTAEKFAQIQEEKRKEMEQQGNGRNGTTITTRTMIR